MSEPARSVYPTLVVSDGGVTGLLAAAIVSEEAARAPGSLRPVIIADTVDALSPDAVVAAVSLHAERFGLEPLVQQPGEHTAHSRTREEAEIRMLLRAAYTAAELGCHRVVWPVHLGPRGPQHGADDEAADTPAARDRLDAIAKAADRALLVGRLVSLDADRWPVPEVTVDTPFLDMADWQVADLLDDLQADPRACWFNIGAAGKSDAAAAERERWGAFRALAVVDAPGG